MHDPADFPNVMVVGAKLTMQRALDCKVSGLVINEIRYCIGDIAAQVVRDRDIKVQYVSLHL